MKKLEEFLREMVTVGTPLCTLFGGVCGIVIAALLLSIGWWRTLIVLFFCAIGLFISGVKCKKNFFHKLDNTVNPVAEEESYMIPKEKALKPEEEEPKQEEASETEQKD